MADSLAPRVIKRINKEFNLLRTQPPEGVRAIVNDDDITDVKVWIRGPAETPYANGYFKIAFAFGPEYPAAPPNCTFSTKIFHPNVGPRGEICVNTLKKDWTSQHTLTEIVTVVKCLLIYPNPESALDEEAGRLLLEKYDEYFDRARLWTEIHGRKTNPPVEFEIPDAVSEAVDRSNARPLSSDDRIHPTSSSTSQEARAPGSSSSLTPPLNGLQPFAASAQANHLHSSPRDPNTGADVDAPSAKKGIGQTTDPAHSIPKEGENRKPGGRSTATPSGVPAKDPKDRRGRKRL